MVDLKMDGIRSWKFTEDLNVLQLVDTDFWIDYDAAVQGTGQAELTLTLNAVWQHTDFDLAKGLARRDFIEERLKELKWDFVGKKGTLIIDESLPQEKTLNDITLFAVDTDEGDFNELMEYSLTFGFPLTSASGVGGIEIARKLSFLKWPHNFFVRAEELDQSPWQTIGNITISVDNLLAPDGTITAEKLDDTDGAIISDRFQNVNVRNDDDIYEGSIFVPVLSSQSIFPGIQFRLEGGTVVETFYTIDQVNGVLTLRTGKVAALEAKMVRVSATWWRIGIRLTNNLTNNDEAEIHLFPSVNTDGSASWIATTQGATHFWGAQVSRVIAARSNPAPYVKTVATSSIPLLDIATTNFIIERSREDRADFKPVFRASPIRISGGPGLETISVIGIKQLTTQADLLDQRQEAEGLVKSWTDLIGSEGLLRIDKDDVAEETIVAHLVNASPTDLGLPDAVTFDLEFNTGFVQ